MKVLVTGGNGFIGRHVINEFYQRGIEIVSFDIVQPVMRLPGVEYIISTVMDKYSLIRHLKGCDGVIHLAAVLGVRRTDKDLLKCMTINIQGTVTVLEACVLSGVPYVLLTSSSEIYGDINKQKVSEDSPFNPKSGYAISKLAGEYYLEAVSREFGLRHNIVRLFNIYGPGQSAEFVVPRFIKMVSEGIAPTVYGDGRQLRSFCHIRDASRAVVDLFFAKDHRGEVFNVGNDLEPITMIDLAQTILGKMKSDLKVKFVPFSESDRNRNREIYYRIPDIEKIKQATGYEPKIMLKEGLEDVIQSNDIPESWADPIKSNNT